MHPTSLVAHLRDYLCNVCESERNSFARAVHKIQIKATPGVFQVGLSRELPLWRSQSLIVRVHVQVQGVGFFHEHTSPAISFLLWKSFFGLPILLPTRSGMTHMGLLVHAHSETRLVFLSPHPFFWCKAPAIKKLNKLDLDRGIVSSFPPLARRVKGFLSPRCVGAAAHRPIFTAYLASRAANSPVVCSLSPCRFIVVVKPHYGPRLRLIIPAPLDQS